MGAQRVVMAPIRVPAPSGDCVDRPCEGAHESCPSSSSACGW